jgi:hypothetical protein
LYTAAMHAIVAFAIASMHHRRACHPHLNCCPRAHLVLIGHSLLIPLLTTVVHIWHQNPILSVAAATWQRPRWPSGAPPPPVSTSHTTFHKPGQTKDYVGQVLYPICSAPNIRFEPLATSSPRISLDFLPAEARFEFSLADSHLGLLLLRNAQGLAVLVCDPMSRSPRFQPPRPQMAVTSSALRSSQPLLAGAAVRAHRRHISAAHSELAMVTRLPWSSPTSGRPRSSGTPLQVPRQGEPGWAPVHASPHWMTRSCCGCARGGRAALTESSFAYWLSDVDGGPEAHWGGVHQDHGMWPLLLRHGHPRTELACHG